MTHWSQLPWHHFLKSHHPHAAPCSNRQEWEKVGEVVAGPDAEDTMAVGGKQLHGRSWVRRPALGG